MTRVVLWLLIAVIGPLVQAETLEGRVIGVSDGDTITVFDKDRDPVKVRLGGIDAPEKKQAYGDRSKQSLSRLVFGQDVRVEWRKRDRYGRVVGQVWVAPENCRDCAKTVDANLIQLRDGMAWWYRLYARDQTEEDGQSYAAAEAGARQRKIGLWEDPKSGTAVGMATPMIMDGETTGNDSVRSVLYWKR